MYIYKLRVFDDTVFSLLGTWAFSVIIITQVYIHIYLRWYWNKIKLKQDNCIIWIAVLKSIDWVHFQVITLQI